MPAQQIGAEFCTGNMIWCSTLPIWSRSLVNTKMSQEMTHEEGRKAGITKSLFLLLSCIHYDFAAPFGQNVSRMNTTNHLLGIWCLHRMLVRGMALLLCAATIGIADAAPRIESMETDAGILVTEAGRKVLFYQRQAKSRHGRHRRANYLHPLYDLDGNVLTEDFPEDHLHHRGVFWAWHHVSVGDKLIGDPWLAEDFSWDVVNAKLECPDAESAVLRLNVVWKSPLWTDEDGHPKPLVEENTNIRIHRTANDKRIIDFAIGLRALERDVRLGGSDDDKGYGGFSIRLRLPENIRFIGERGDIAPRRQSVESGPGLDMSGTFGDCDSISGLTVLCHPTTPGAPQRWILRQTGSMQNAVFPGREPVPLSQETPLLLRYRMILHRGAADPDRIQNWYEKYKTLP